MVYVCLIHYPVIAYRIGSLVRGMCCCAWCMRRLIRLQPLHEDGLKVSRWMTELWPAEEFMEFEGD